MGKRIMPRTRTPLCFTRIFIPFDELLTHSFAPDHSCQENLPAAVEAVLERTQDFTDSAYTSHEHREAILESSERLKAEVDHLLGLYANIVSTQITPSFILLLFVVRIQLRRDRSLPVSQFFIRFVCSVSISFRQSGFEDPPLLLEDFFARPSRYRLKFFWSSKQ